MVVGVILVFLCLGFVCMDCIVVYNGRRKTDKDRLVDIEEQKKAIDDYLEKKRLKKMKKESRQFNKGNGNRDNKEVKRVWGGYYRLRTFSSVGQSIRLITGRSRVRVPKRPLEIYKLCQGGRLYV